MYKSDSNLLLQNGLAMAIVGQNTLHKRIKSRAVVVMTDVRKLVYNHVIHRLRRVHHDTKGKAETVLRAAASKTLGGRGDTDTRRYDPHSFGKIGDS